MKHDYESTDEASAAKLAADEAIPDPPPDPSEYEPIKPEDEFEGDYWVCPTCGEKPAPMGQRCDRCKRYMEHDRLERESGR